MPTLARDVMTVNPACCTPDTPLEQVAKLIEAVNKRGISVLLVEQNLHQSLRIAHRGYVLEKGAVVLAGTGQELLANDYVRRAFLGH